MRIGFIGLGNMGGPMALNLIKAGHALVVHDVRSELAKAYLERGASDRRGVCCQPPAARRGRASGAGRARAGRLTRAAMLGQHSPVAFATGRAPTPARSAGAEVAAARGDH